MMDQTSPSLPLDLSVSPRDIETWEREKVRLEREVSDLTAKIDQISRRINAAETLFSLLGQGNTPGRSERAKESPANQVIEASHGGTSIISAVFAVIQSEPAPIAPYQIKEKLADGELGKRIKASDKGFYNAISRLTERGKIKKHNGWLFTPDGLQSYLARVKVGEIADEKPAVPTRSPMGDIILEFIRGNPGSTSGDVIAYLKASPEIDAALSPNPTVAYNIISRLTQRDQIIKRDGKLYPLDSEAKEPPTELIGSGSNASEGDTSLNINPQPNLQER